MPFARWILAPALAAIITTRAAPAQTLTPPHAAVPPPACARTGVVKLIGVAPLPRTGENLMLQIAPVTAETEALAKDMVDEIDVLKPLEAHMSTFDDYTTALGQMAMPQPSSSPQTFDEVRALYAAQDAHDQVTAVASNEFSSVAVGSKGEFTCGGLTAGTYILLLTESDIIPPTADRDAWGPSLPNETLYELRVVVPKVRKASTVHLRRPFIMIARFRPMGA